MDNLLPKLKQNATIAFIAPAGSIKNKENIDRARDYFQGLGYKVVYGRHLFGKNKYMSGTDEERLSDLYWAFEDKNINAIICARGGYGCLRLINQIDYTKIRANKKLFCGYSDITVLSSMFFKNAGLITYSGPMANGDFGNIPQSEFTLNEFFKTVQSTGIKEYKAEKLYTKGKAEGILWGGNLASIVSMCGIDFLPDENFIFFTEDLNEPAYKIDKMFTQLMNIDNFRERVKGIILGDFLDNGYPEQLDEMFLEIGKELNIPVLGGFKITHQKDKITVPYGLKANICENILKFEV